MLGSKNLRVDTFPDPIRHFGDPYWQFWILQEIWHCSRWASDNGDSCMIFFYNFGLIELYQWVVYSLLQKWEKKLRTDNLHNMHRRTCGVIKSTNHPYIHQEDKNKKTIEFQKSKMSFLATRLRQWQFTLLTCIHVWLKSPIRNIPVLSFLR